MGDEELNVDVVAGAAEIAEATREKLKSDPDAVRKILSQSVTVQEDVTVYPNKELNLRYAKFNEKITELATRLKRNDGEEDEAYKDRIDEFRKDYEAAVKEFDALKAEIADSAVTFTLVSPGRKAIKNLRTAARKKYPLPEQGETEDLDISEEREDYYKDSIIAAHLVADGYTREDIENIRDNWPTRCWAQLWTTANKLTIADDFLGAGFNPDF